MKLPPFLFGRVSKITMTYANKYTPSEYQDEVVFLPSFWYYSLVSKCILTQQSLYPLCFDVVTLKRFHLEKFIFSYTSANSMNNFVPDVINHKHFVFTFLNLSNAILMNFRGHFACRYYSIHSRVSVFTFQKL